MTEWINSLPRFSAVLFVTLLAGCTGSPHPGPISNTDTNNVPASIELRTEIHANTLHFPAGTYLLSATDKIGYYYRAPGKIIQHAAGSSFPRDGGIFVSKRNRGKVRGYVYLGGALTQVGNFSKTDYVFRNNSEEPDVPAAGPY